MVPGTLPYGRGSVIRGLADPREKLFLYRVSGRMVLLRFVATAGEATGSGGVSFRPVEPPVGQSPQGYSEPGRKQSPESQERISTVARVRISFNAGAEFRLHGSRRAGVLQEGDPA